MPEQRYHVATQLAARDREVVFRFLTEETYWAAAIPRDVFERAVDNSISFVAYDGDEFAGYARVVTDKATFAWLCDVFVVSLHRGNGVARLLLDAVMAHPDLQGLRNFMLATRDAHGLYAKYGFTPLAEPARWMAIRRPYRTER